MQKIIDRVSSQKKMTDSSGTGHQWDSIKWDCLSRVRHRPPHTSSWLQRDLPPNDPDTRNQKKHYQICLPCLVVVSQMGGRVGWTMEVVPTHGTSCAGCTTAQKIIMNWHWAMYVCTAVLYSD
jgi:hypothetical protein